MRTVLLLLTATMAACAAEPTTAETQQDITFCNAPFYVWCSPYFWGGDQETCQRSCNTSNGVAGFCPEYDQETLDYCAHHPGQLTPDGTAYECGFDGTPRLQLRCEVGFWTLTGSGD